MVKLPGELATLVALLDTQPGQVQVIIQYCLALLMVELGQAELIRTESGEIGEQCIFETTAGDVFTVIKPSLSDAEEAAMMEILREILEEKGEA